MDLALHQAVKVIIVLIIAVILMGGATNLSSNKQSTIKVREITEVVKDSTEDINKAKDSFYR